MLDSAGSSFSLMYLPSGAGDIPTLQSGGPLTGAVLPVTAAFLASLNLPPAWLNGDGILCAVYALGATPAAIASAPAPNTFAPNYGTPASVLYPYLGKNPTDVVNVPADYVVTPFGPVPQPI